MKLFPSLSLALLVAAPALASAAATFQVDFEKNWAYDPVDAGVNGYYGGGTAADGSTGANLGVSFVNVAGLSNDAFFTYYTGAPSSQGTAYAYTLDPSDKALLNVAAGVDGALSFYYASPSAALGAVKAYSGLNGTGTLLGTFDLAANSSSAYDVWTKVTFSFAGSAKSFDLTGSANLVGLDNISAAPVPEASSALMVLLGGLPVALGLMARRRRAA